MSPFVGITTRFRDDIQSYSLHQGYVHHVIRAGGVPVLLPCTEQELCRATLPRLDAILLSGGEDIDPSFSGAPSQAGYGYQPRRDAFEIELARLAMRRPVPTLGICRGGQLLYVATGHTLVADIPSLAGHRIAHRRSVQAPSCHDVTLIAGSRVHAACQVETLSVISYHHQGITVGTAPEPPWLATAHSADRVVEAIEHTGDAWAVGVLWHPELSTEDEPDPVIRSFVQAAS